MCARIAGRYLGENACRCEGRLSIRFSALVNVSEAHIQYLGLVFADNEAIQKQRMHKRID